MGVVAAALVIQRVKGRFDKVSAQRRRRRGQAKRSHAAELLDMTGIPLIEIRSERIPRRMASLDWPHV
jgi:hypothetical protein